MGVTTSWKGVATHGEVQQKEITVCWHEEQPLVREHYFNKFSRVRSDVDIFSTAYFSKK